MLSAFNTHFTNKKHLRGNNNGQIINIFVLKIAAKFNKPLPSFLPPSSN